MHKEYLIYAQKIKQNLKGINDQEIRKRAYLLLLVLESKRNIKQACAHHGLPRRNFYRWIKLLQAGNFNLSVLKSKSRRPNYSPKKTPKEIEELVIQLRGNTGKGGKFISKLAYEKYKIKIAPSTVDEIFKRYGISKRKKVPKKNTHTKRYSCKKPLERVQFDSVELGIHDAYGNKLFAITAIDDCARVAFIHLCYSKGALEAKEALEKFIEKYGIPDCAQTDGGSEFTCKYNSLLNSRRKKEPKLSGFEQACIFHKIRHYIIRPRTPQLNGKIERFHRTIRQEFELETVDGKSFDEIEKHIQNKLFWYNNERFHHSINMLTPYQKYQQAINSAA